MISCSFEKFKVKDCSKVGNQRQEMEGWQPETRDRRLANECLTSLCSVGETFHNSHNVLWFGVFIFIPFKFQGLDSRLDFN